MSTGGGSGESSGRGVWIEDAAGSRRIASEAFPLIVGGPESDIPIPGLASEAAYLGLAEGDVFVQSAENGTVMTCNGARLQSSQWLQDGDVLRVETSRIEIRAKGDGWRLVVSAAAADAQRAAGKPVITPPARAKSPGQRTIQPAQFSPRPLTPPERPGFRLQPTTVGVLIVLALAAGAAWFVLTAHSVAVEIEPVPDEVALEGAVLPIRIGGRYLLRPGTYTVKASKEGYEPLAAELVVSAASGDTTARYELEKLPGLLTVRAPEGTTVEVSGIEVGRLPMAPLELPPGQHALVLRADRFFDFSTVVEIEGGGVEQTLEVELEPRWAPVAIDSQPAGAAVRIDGESLGQTPARLDVLEGRHDLELVLRGYKPYRRSLLVAAGEPQELDRISLQPSDGNLLVQSEPAGASVTVDGTYRGKTPLDLDITPGHSHELRFSLAGHETERREVQVASGQSEELIVALRAQSGEVEVKSNPADAELFVDGRSVGTSGQTLTLSAVPHEIELRREGYETYRSSVTPRPDYPLSLGVILKSVEQARQEAIPQSITSPGGQALILIQPGRFQMGASRREPGRRANETLHQVELTRPFYISTMEVSNEEFRKFKRDHDSGLAGSTSLDTNRQPVVRVSWEEAALYCNWLSEQASLKPVYTRVDGKLTALGSVGTGYRLPTEAEWTWVARYRDGGGGESDEGLKYPWGQSLPVAEGAGNFADQSARDIVPGVLPSYQDGFPATAPVDSFQPNARGIFNLGGNVAEWMHDWYTIYPSDSTALMRDPTGPAEGEFHVIRGSSWMDSTITELRLSYRDYSEEARPDVGFRIARYLE